MSRWAWFYLPLSMVKSRLGIMTLLAVLVVILSLFVFLQTTGAQQDGIFAHLGPTEPTVIRPQRLPTRDELSPPRRIQPKHVNAVQIKSDANKLAVLAQKIPGQVGQIQSTLPKDLSKQLKEIEKLARRLRREITQ